MKANLNPTLAALALAGALPACSADNAPADEVHTSAANAQGPLYLIATSLEAGDERETYLVTSPSFDRTTKIDPTGGPKLLGGTVPVVQDGAVFVPDAGRPVMMRYDVDKSGRLEKTQELSFMGAGVTELFSWHVFIVEKTKGYVFDQAGTKIVVWNPETMELGGKVIDLTQLTREGWAPNLVFEHSGPVRRGDQLVIPLGWADQDGNARHATGALVLDSKTDDVIAVLEDERCGESYATVVDPSGDIYFFPPEWSAAPHYFAEGHQPTCVLRLRSGETAFDADHVLDLSQLGSGSAAAGAIPDGAGGFFFTGIDAKLWNGGEAQDEPVWRFYHYDFKTARARAVDSLPLWSSHGYYMNVGGRAYIPREDETADTPRTVIYSVEGAADPVELFSFDASWYGAAKLR